MFSKMIPFLILAAFCSSATGTPLPKCSPLRFINKIVESEGMLWITEGLPGHPVPDCDLDHIVDLGDLSVVAYAIGQPERLLDTLDKDRTWLLESAIPRLLVGQYNKTFYVCNQLLS
jgi:hypothetical protein